MAAAGGGKIRSRRYHIASKPYAKGKQQQSGLISRVTDTVKSIVPSWLQKYFNNGDAAEEGTSVQTTEENCQPPPPNGSEEGPPTLDGRDSPEPEPSTSNTEPSTSRATLNFQENMLCRPPLSRSQLHLTPLDTFSTAFGGSSSMFSQPSTSSAPGPFSTGYSLVKEIKDNLSVHEDDNISTTSGFSSRASDKDVPTSKTSSLPQLWSPETDRTHSGPQPSQSSLKKPAFNLSVFRTSSNSSLNSTVLNSSQLGDSPFYPGKTMYGGASAVRSSRTRPGTPYQAPVRRQIKAKPAGTQPCGVTSATARRILQSLERMSSPLADAKRIPAGASSFPSPSLQTVDDINMDVSNHQSKKKKIEPSLPPVQKLVVPVMTPVSGNRSVSFRPTLTPGGMSRPLAKAAREIPARQSPLLPEATPGQSLSTMGSSEPVYPLSSTPAASSSAASGGGKIKRERTTTRPSTKHQDDDEVVEAPDLPTIPLPIRTSALPSFNFSSPLPPLSTTTVSISSTSKITATTPAKESLTNKDPPKASTPPSVPFTFSSPIVKATAASPPSFTPSAGFTFSAPVAKLGPSISNGKLAIPSTAAVRSATNKSTEDFEGPFKPAKTLKQGSVIDILRGPEFASPVAQISPSPKVTTQPKPEQSTASTTTTSTPSSSAGFAGIFKTSTDWTCDVCLVPNKLSDTKCVCCAAPQPNSSSKSTDNKQSPAASVGQESSTTNTPISTTTGFGTLFSKPTGTWDCDTCLVINKPDAVKCVACETAKPGTGLKPSLTLPFAFSAAKTLSTPAAPASTGFTGFGDKFKKPEGAWECDTCMVQNKAEDTKCVACTSPKPGASADATSSASSSPVFGLGDKFKKPEGAWDCDVCLVQNKAADTQCVACQSPKPGASVEPKAFASSFGAPAEGTTLGSSTSTSGSFKFGTSDITEESTSGIKFGGSFMQKTSSTSGFKFGVPFGTSTPETSKDNAASSGFKFGSSTDGFKFGAALSEDKKSDQPAAGSGFKFGSSGSTVFETGSSSTESNSSKGGFTFGLSKPEEKTSDTSTCSSSVNFTSDQPAQEKPIVETSSNDITSTSSNTMTTTTSAGSVFGRLGEATNASQGSAAFGSLQANKEPAAPAFSFGKKEDKDVAGATVPSNFSFGVAPQEAEPTVVTTGDFSFNKPSAPTEQPPPAFTFGKPADKSELVTSDAPKPTFTFGQNVTDSAAPKPAFSFRPGNPVNSTSSTTTSSSTPTPSLFGGSSTTTTSSISSTPAPAPSATPNAFVFGQMPANANNAPPAKAFCFGQTQDSQPPAARSAPLNSTSAPAPAQPFIFGAPANAAPPAAAPSFRFGAAAPSAASSSAPSTAPTPFTFSSAPSSGFGANQAPSFGSSFGSPFSATPSQAPGFGAKANAAPVFGQQTNSTPVFGGAANSAPASGAFQFAGSSGFGAANNTSGVFTFGAGAAGSPAPATNPSIAPQSGTPGSGFTFNQPPAFNMGSNKSFTASPAGQQAIAGRKIKTAVRRRK